MRLAGLFAVMLTSTLSAADQPDLTALLTNRIDTGKAVAIVAATVDSSGVHVQSAGKLSDAGKSPDGNTVFEIGSASKVFTSLLLADAVERGEVKPDDPVAKYLPAGSKVPSRNGRQITLLEISQQVSGLPRMPDNFKPADWHNPYADYTGKQLLAFLASYQLTRDPGQKFEYSNLAVGLLGFALANRAGVSYEQLLKQRILDPLQMTSTSIKLTADQRARLAPPHDGTLNPSYNWDLDALAGAGGIRSTANDLARFLSAELGFLKTPLAAAMRRMREATLQTTDIPDTKIAMAWFVTKTSASEVWWHNGMTGGYASFVGFDPATRRGAILLTNATVSLDDIGMHAVDNSSPAGLIEVTRDLKEAPLDAKAAANYVGVYEFQPSVNMTIRALENHVYAQLTGQGSIEISSSKPDEFFYKVVEARIVFHRDPTGRVSSLELHQNGRVMPAKRIADTPPPAPVEMKVDPATLASYAGKYQLAPGAEFTIAARDGRLYAEITGQPEAEIFADKPDEFFYKIVDARITFNRDSSGKVIGLTLHQGGRDMPARRVP